jgi:hypothetical protein
VLFHKLRRFFEFDRFGDEVGAPDGLDVFVQEVFVIGRQRNDGNVAQLFARFELGLPDVSEPDKIDPLADG